jgi:hypothetical protein
MGLVFGALACLLSGWAAFAGEVKVWEMPERIELQPENPQPLNELNWPSAEAGATFKAGAAMRNGKIQVLAQVGGAGLVLKSVKPDSPGVLAVNLISANEETSAKIEKLELIGRERMEKVLRLKSGAAEFDVKLKAGQPFVEIAPVKDAVALELKGRTQYALLPDFFGYDTVYDPRRFRSAKLSVPAENFIVGLEAGGAALTLCVWQGALTLGKQAEKSDREPRVDLFLRGEIPSRIIERTRIEFAGKSVYVALLAAKGIWHEEAVSEWEAQKVVELPWSRPFESKWRINFLGKEDGWSKDMFARSLSNNVLFREDPARWEGDVPKVSLQGLWPYFIYPFWVNKEKAFVALYADMNERKDAEKRNNAEKAAAKKENREFKPVYPKNIFERVVIYPLDRHKETPPSELTLVDVVRDTLGQGPCEYVLDLEGVKGRPSGGSRDTLGATCGIFDNHISKFVQAAQGKNTHYAIGDKKLAGVQPGEKFAPEFEARLIQALEDMSLFVTAVNARIVEYQKFAEKMTEFCAAESKQAPQVKPLADKISAKAKQLAAEINKKLPGMTKQRDDWAAKITGLVGEVKDGNYKNIGASGGIRSYAEGQDVFISFARRFVKAVREDASAVDSAELEIVKFSTKVRSICHDVLRNKHGMEGW